MKSEYIFKWAEMIGQLVFSNCHFVQQWRYSWQGETEEEEKGEAGINYICRHEGEQ